MKQPKLKHIMVDLETLGTRADSVILSIGAVKFDVDKIDDAAFYASVSIESNLASGRNISEDTLVWWLKQSLEAQKVFHEPKIPLTAALEDLATWIGDGDYFVWGNGADFDQPMLAHAFSTHGLEIPWKFWNNRCFRTMKNLPFAQKLPKPPVAHNAALDALSQVRQLQAIWKEMEK